MHADDIDRYEGPPCEMCRTTNFIGTCTHRPLKRKAQKREFTSGPWDVLSRKDSRGNVVENLIFTRWIHGQLEDHAPVVTGMTTVQIPEEYAKLYEESGQKAYHGVHIRDDDAHLIAHCPDLLAAVKKDQEELCSAYCPSTWVTAEGRPHRERCKELRALISKIEDKP